MFNNFFNWFRLCTRWRLFFLILFLILMVITLYQMLITLFAPCFGNVFILLLEYCTLICLGFWVIFDGRKCWICSCRKPTGKRPGRRVIEMAVDSHRDYHRILYCKSGTCCTSPEQTSRRSHRRHNFQ